MAVHKKDFMKLTGNRDIEDSLGKLDKLKHEEACWKNLRTRGACGKLVRLGGANARGCAGVDTSSL
jgi:hypothetical protein